jgi:hypothetical protein
MDAKLKEAIEIIENFGGFVLFPEDHEEEKQIRQQTFDMEREIDIQNEERRMLDVQEALNSRNEYLQNKKKAFRDMRKLFHEPRFIAQSTLKSYEELEDILLENGLDLDNMEDFIESMV